MEARRRAAGLDAVRAAANDFPPHDLAAERALLGAMLLSQDAAGLALERVRETDFYDSRHTALYRVLARLYDDGVALDAVVIQKALAEASAEAEAGGMEYVKSLLDEVPSAANVEYYLELVRERSLRRTLLDTATGVQRGVYDETRKTDDLLDAAEQAFYSIASEERVGAVRHISEVVKEVVAYIEKLHEMPVMVTGLSTGYMDLDSLTSGFHAGEFVVVAGRPSMGKTTFALNLVRKIAVKDGKPVLFFSLEMTAEQLTQNLLCCHCRIDGGLLRTGRISRDDYEQLIDVGAADLYEAPVFIEDQAGLTLPDIRGRARRYAHKEKIAAIFVDYLQLVREPWLDSREQQVAEISRGLKGLAKDLKVPVVALSQLNRHPEARTDRRPMLADLRESGAIEQDADVVMLLHRPDYYNANERPGELEVNVAKNRNGPTGMVTLYYARNLMRMEDLARERG